MKNEKKKVWKSITVIAIVLSVLAVAMAGTASAKSVYIVANHHATPTTPINAYDMQPGPSLVLQGTYQVPSHALGASGLACYNDPDGNGLADDARLFVTYESSGIIEVFDATTLTSLGSVTTTASDLTGIVVDQGKQLAYATSRHNKNLYVIDANTLAILSTNALTIDDGGFGIALDEANGLLYVADGDNTVDYFDTTNWAEQGTITVGNSRAIGVAIDVTNQYLYTGGGFRNDNLLCKYDLTTSTSSCVDLSQTVSGMGAMGLAVDRDFPYDLYVTTGYSGDDLRVFDSNLNQLYLYPHAVGEILNPAGICICQAATGVLTIHKDDGVTQCVNPGDTFTYTISYQNTGAIGVHNVVITDTLPGGVTYVSCTGGGIYNVGPPETVTWNIGTISVGTSGSVTVTVTVNAGTEGTTLLNFATIDSDETQPRTDSEATPVCQVGNCCVCPPGSNPGDPCECTQAIDQNDCVNNLKGTWRPGCVPGTTTGCEGLYCQNGACIPEFSTIAIPVASILGLLFFFNYRKRKREQ